jgi:exopolysaccharide biosynthesis operon protein EpsL
LRDSACVTIPIHETLSGSGVVGARPGAWGASSESARTQLKKNLPIGPLLSVASLCFFPMAVNAQGTGTSPLDSTPPATASQPSTPSQPSMPSGPSQPSGAPQPGGTPQTSGTFAPAGTQASMLSPASEPTYQFRVMGGIEHENNIFRVASGAGTVSDSVGIAGLGFKADKRYGLQRFRADLEANTYRYNNHSELDYSVFNYALAWDWSFTPRLHGVVSADRKQFREVNTDPATLLNSVGRRTERAEVAEGIYELGAAWRLLAGATHTQANSTEPNSWDGSPSVTSGRVGVGYEFASGSSVYARYRHGDGKYNDPTPGAPTGSFRDDESDLQLKWPVTGKTSVEARLGHLSRKHDVGPQRDFSGMVGSAAVNWDVTGKTRVVAGYSRDLGASGLASGGTVRGDRFYIGPVWTATAQIAVNLRYERVARDWKDVPAGSPESGRNETLQVLSAGVDWQPRRWLTVSGYARGERQQSNLNVGYRNTTVGAALKGYF